MPQFSIMSDDDLIRHVETTRDPLTTTALELELTARLMNANEAAAQNQPLIDVLENRGIDDPAALEGLLALVGNLKDVLDEHELPEDAEVLKAELEALAAAREAIGEADEAFTKARDALAVPA